MTKESKIGRQNRGNWLAGGGVLSGLAAFVGASCCVLPIILVNLGLGSALFASYLAFFARARLWLLGAAAIFILAAFIVAFRGGRRPSLAVISTLIIATLITISAYGFPYIEPDVLRWLSLR